MRTRSMATDCGLVEREPRGRYAFYRLSDPHVTELLRTADARLAEVALGVDACDRCRAPEHA